MIDLQAINEVAEGWYTGGTYSVDDEKKLVSYKLKGGAMSVSVIEAFVRLANHTGYNFQTNFNEKELLVSPGMTDEQVKKNFFGENYEAPKKIDTYSIDEVANGEYTRGTYEVDDEKKVVSYKLKAGAVASSVIEKFTELANHTGYVFQTKFNNRELSISPGMTEKQALETYNKSQLMHIKTDLLKSQNSQTTQEYKDAPQVKENRTTFDRNIFSRFGLFRRRTPNC